MRRSARPLGICLALMLALLTPAPWSAQGADPAAEKRESQEKAREARVQEYLKKKEERRARREAEAKRKQEEAEAKRTAEEMARKEAEAKRAVEAAARERAKAAPQQAQAQPQQAQAAPQAQDSAKAAKQARKAEKKKLRAERKQAKQAGKAEATNAPLPSRLPRALDRIHQGLRQSQFGQDPTVVEYLDLIQSGEASAQQVAAFGNFLGQAGRPETALAYYDLALALDDRDTTIWINAGTLQRQAGNLGSAAAAYSRALSIDPDHAYAHYNLGAVLDELGEYDAAIDEYKLALSIDPTLGDPAINPQAANNAKLTAVRMMLYKEQAGSLGLPLVTVPKGEIEKKN